MAGKKSDLGPTGQTVADNVQRLRTRLNLTYAELSRRLETAGRPIPVLGLGRIEKGERRVDADDLMALAVALEVSPLTLLMTDTDSDDKPVHATGFDAPITAGQVWNWLRADRPATTRTGLEGLRQPVDFILNAAPSWSHRSVIKALADAGEFLNSHTQQEAMPDGDD